MSFKWRTGLWISAAMLLILMVNGLVFIRFYTQTMLDDKARSLMQSTTRWEMKLHAPLFLSRHLGWVSNPNDAANEPPPQPGIDSIQDVLLAGQNVRIWNLNTKQLIREFYLEDPVQWKAVKDRFGWLEQVPGHGQNQGVNLQQTIGGIDYFVVQMTLEEQKLGGKVGLQLIEQAEPLQTQLATVRNRVLWGLAVNVFLVLGIAYLLARKTIHPLNLMIRDIRNMDGEHFHQRLTYPVVKDELHALAEHFNGLLQRLEWSSDKQKQLVADASHEFRTPITIIEGHANLIKRWGKYKPDVLDESIEAILSESDRMKQIASQLLLLATLDSGTKHAEQLAGEEVVITDLSVVIQELLRSFRALHPDIEWEEQLPEESMSVTLPPLYAYRIFTNLIENAMKYGGAGKRIRIKAQSDVEKIEVTVADFGDGIAPDDLPHIFDRFYRAEQSRNRGTGGVGLGLSIVKQIVEQYGGTIQAQSILDHGTTMTVCFPRALQKV